MNRFPLVKESYLHEQPCIRDYANLRGSKWRISPQDLQGNISLLVLDMQNYFLDPRSHAFVPSAPDVIQYITELARLAFRMRWTIVFTQHTNTLDDAGRMSKWWRDLLNPDSQEAALHPEIDRLYQQGLSEKHNVVLITKHQYDAFYDTNLDATLQKNSTDTVLVTGVMTHLCCETTARSAFVRGYNVIFPADATATYNRELHAGTLRAMAHGFGKVPLASEILHLFSDLPLRMEGDSNAN